MVYASIGGMQLNRWSGYFKIIVPTMRVLKAAKRAEGCVKADTFKAGNVYFAVSIWEKQEQMQAFAKSGLHGQLTQVAMDQMALFYNYSQALDDVPDRKKCVSVWKDAIAARDGKGSVGVFSE